MKPNLSMFSFMITASQVKEIFFKNPLCEKDILRSSLHFRLYHRSINHLKFIFYMLGDRSREAIYSYLCVYQLLSYVQLFATPWTIARQAPLFLEFSRQEYWNGLPFPFSRGSFLPRDQTRVSCTQADSLPSESPGKPNLYLRESIGIDGEAIREATLVTQLVKNLPTMQETPV